MIVEVTRQIDDEARLLAGLDDDVERLHTEGAWRVRGEPCQRFEVDVLGDTLADCGSVLLDGEPVVVVDGRGR